MILMKSQLFFYFTFFFCATTSVFKVQASSYSVDESTGLFSSEEPLHITIKTDLKLLLKSKKAVEFQEGEMAMAGKIYPIRVKARSNYHREDCSFPPITLSFSQTQFIDQSHNQLAKLKLANACKMQKSYEQYILQEYLIYRAFNILTDKSFKVRLLAIEYVDSKEKVEGITKYGYVVEDEYTMARRLGGVIMKKPGIKDQATNKKHIVIMSIFQFMIGNTNWQIPKLHHVSLVKLNNATESKPYVIPRDFDQSGMIDATYAIPSPILDIETVRERYYQGRCYTSQELKEGINHFVDKKDVLYHLYERFNLLDSNALKSSIEYLDSFYNIIEDESRWKQFFVDKCLGKR